jgi:PAS domain S-box-containing protein
MTDKERIKLLEDKIKNLHEGYRKQLLNLEKFKAMVMNLNLGLMVVDNDETITKVYSSFESLTGYTAEELVGKKASDVLLRKGDVISDLQLKEQHSLRENGDSSVYEIPIIAKNGEELWLTISGAPLYDDDGNKIGSIGIHWDITRQKRLQQSLQQAREESDRAKQAEERFLAKMSHEIRTPLNAVIGMSYLLKGTEINQEQKEYVDVISRSGNLLLNLINDILDYSKVSSGQIQLRQTPIDLKVLLTDLAQTFRLKTLDKPLSIKTDIDVEEDAVLADETLLNQVLMNLMSNAEKFTEEGSITIIAQPLAVIGDTITYQFTVEDTGSGIAPDRLEAIFQEFVQEDGIILRDGKGGTGLGLAITKKIVELMDGKIWAESTLNLGTSIHFVVPFQIAKVQTNDGATRKAVAIETTQAVDTKIDSSLSILVAEDNSMNQKYISRILDKIGVYYEIVENGHLAQKICGHQKFDVIFMDLFMPLVDGFDATKHIRKTENPNQHTPIYALTATAVAQHKKRALTVGMEGFISKPFHPNEIKLVLSEITNQKDQNSAHTLFIENDNSMTFNFHESFDSDSLKMYYDGDIEYTLEMFEIFIDQLAESLPVLKSAIEAGDRSNTRHYVHKLKPTFTMVGFPRTTTYFEKWERMIDEGLDRNGIQNQWEGVRSDIIGINQLVSQEIERIRLYIQRSS